MKDRVYVLGTPVHNLTMQETINLVDDAIAGNQHIHHSVVNAGKIVAMHENMELRESVINADIINADGQAVIWISKIFGQPLKERVTGIDLMGKVVELAHRKNYKIFLLGAQEEVLQKVIEKFSRQYSPEIIAGYRNGYFRKEDEQEVVQQIADSKANILFVAISSPVKENLLYQNRDVLRNVNFIMGVGGSFDVVSGIVKRAPLWMQGLGLEWFFRVLQEPRRMFKRYLIGNLKFIALVFRYILNDYKFEPLAKNTTNGQLEMEVVTSAVAEPKNKKTRRNNLTKIVD
ncbi:WecB/TagA/CpsF family glycosyltransferase [Chitinophagaceae bacterium LB-8]|jgi:N-acetylglucosaminyldiphosphoundecaprenol N-acetyl-beta-D-mannosaminyltransferase|uniref:WecB/TagA/CpsF family glycosyltransferase n=1 Tax=Paraflavisolibacter caeni TaxID=2982496 RepID=A0A9X2XXE4_9BACT|nr:WecB/TagA/CpsF family glycosyltransferase [Paraflavisolibacter caeni]MCU7550845.1 WecB/TagA/CpsF family glycosyltransferase [Paraflavisolibacter caeni]